MIFVGDGASWCRGLKEDHFPEATYVLDFWHLARNIKVSLGAERKELIREAKLLDLISYVNNNKVGMFIKRILY